MSLSQVEIIGAVGCPYVQRVVLHLLETQTPFSYKNVDLQQKPEWFLKKSPLGKVPVAVWPDGQYIFESLVIVDYIDSLLPAEKQLAPADPFVRATNKAWVEYIGSIFSDSYGAIAKGSKAELEAALEPISKKFAALEEHVKGPFFNGEKISLIDIASAPLFQRVAVFDSLLGLDAGDKSKYPKVKAWFEKLINLPALNQAAEVQADKEGYTNTHDIGSIVSRHADPIAVRKVLAERSKAIFKTRFPQSYLATL